MEHEKAESLNFSFGSTDEQSLYNAKFRMLIKIYVIYFFFFFEFLTLFPKCFFILAILWEICARSLPSILRNWKPVCHFWDEWWNMAWCSCLTIRFCLSGLGGSNPAWFCWIQVYLRRRILFHWAFRLGAVFMRGLFTRL